MIFKKLNEWIKERLQQGGSGYSDSDPPPPGNFMYPEMWGPGPCQEPGCSLMRGHTVPHEHR